MSILIKGMEMPLEKSRVIQIFPEGTVRRLDGSIYNSHFMAVPAADVRPVVTCADCKHNNHCLTQAFVEEESRVPFDRNTFFCADGKRADDA